MGKKNRHREKKKQTHSNTPPQHVGVTRANEEKRGEDPNHESQATHQEHPRTEYSSRDEGRPSTVLNTLLMLIFTGVIAIATTVYAVLVWQQLKVMSKQLGIMNGQLEEARRIGPRPWVGLNDERPALQTGPLTIDNKGTAHVACSISLKNFGDYPAQGVFAGAELMITQNVTSVHAREKAMAGESVGDQIGSVLFPGPSGVGWRWSPAVAQSEMIRIPNGGDMFQAYVVGCIFYRDQFGTPHHTGFAYRCQVPGTIQGVTFEPKPDTAITGEWVLCHGFVD